MLQPDRKRKKSLKIVSMFRSNLSLSLFLSLSLSLFLFLVCTKNLSNRHTTLQRRTQPHNSTSPRCPSIPIHPFPLTHSFFYSFWFFLVYPKISDQICWKIVTPMNSAFTIINCQKKLTSCFTKNR